WAVRWRRALPRTFNVFTLVTLTLNNSCTAWRIWVLFARGSATTVYWLKASAWRVPFSVRRTVLIISKEFMLELLLVFGQTRLDFFKCALGENQFIGAQHIVGVQSIARGERDLFHVARSKGQVLVHF